MNWVPVWRHQRQCYQSVDAVHANYDGVDAAAADAADDDVDGAADDADQDRLGPFRHQRHQSVEAMHANADL